MRDLFNFPLQLEGLGTIREYSMWIQRQSHKRILLIKAEDGNAHIQLGLAYCSIVHIDIVCKKVIGTGC